MSLSVPEIISQSKILFSNLGIPNAYLFGSYAKGIQTESSDIDFVIYLGYKKLPLSALFKIADAKETLESTFNKEVDLIVSPSEEFYEKIKNHVIRII